MSLSQLLLSLARSFSLLNNPFLILFDLIIGLLISLYEATTGIGDRRELSQSWLKRERDSQRRRTIGSGARRERETNKEERSAFPLALGNLISLACCWNSSSHSLVLFSRSYMDPKYNVSERVRVAILFIIKNGHFGQQILIRSLAHFKATD